MFNNNGIFLLTGHDEHREEVVKNFVSRCVKRNEKCLFMNTDLNIDEIKNHLKNNGFNEEKIKELIHFKNISKETDVQEFIFSVKEMNSKNCYNNAIFSDLSILSKTSHGKSKHIMDHLLKDLKNQNTTVILDVSNDIDTNHLVDLEIESDISLDFFNQDDKTLISINGSLNDIELNKEMKKDEFIENFLLN